MFLIKKEIHKLNKLSKNIAKCGVRRPASADFHQLKLAAQPGDGYSDSDDAAGAV